MARNGRVSVAVVALACGLVACTGGTDETDKAGGTRTTQLTLVTAEGEGRPGAAIADAFAAAVAESGAAVDVSVEYDLGAGDVAWDQAAIDALDGEADLALVPARAWASRDVTSLDVLQLPALIESDEQADLLVQDRPLVDELLAGLSVAGVHGVGLYPESLRAVAMLGATTPMSARALDHVRVRAPLAPVVWQTIEALGGTPVDLVDFQPGTGPDEVGAVESQLSLLPTLPGSPWGMTIDLPLYYKFQVLAVAADTWDRLDVPARQALAEAARTALDVTLADRARLIDAVDDACESGTFVLLAGATGDAVREILAARVEEAAGEAATGRFVEAVREAVAHGAGVQSLTCPGPAHATWETVPAQPGSIPDGTYRVVLDEAGLRAAGWPEDDVEDAVGTFTFVLDDGHYTWAQHSDTPVRGATHGAGTYQVDGDAVQWAWGPEAGGFVTRTTWARTDTPGLVFAATPEVAGPAGYSFIQVHELERIG